MNEIDKVKDTYNYLVGAYSIEKNRTTQKWIQHMKLTAKSCIDEYHKNMGQNIDSSIEEEYKYIKLIANL